MTFQPEKTLDGKPDIALAIVGSNTTAIAAELVAEATGYPGFHAIIRRGTATSLPVAMDGEPWAARLKNLGWFGAGKEIRAFQEHLATLTGGRPFDCFIHHSKDPFSQLLSGHPLCRRYFYIEEGFTALIGGTFGRPRKRPFRKLFWRLKSRLFYGGLINRYREFFDTGAANYGGAFAWSRGAFKNFPGRVQLVSREVGMALPAPARLIVFLDSQYLIGNCTEEEYTRALEQGVREIAAAPVSLAVKFHPAEKDAGRRQRIIARLAAIGNVAEPLELPAEFVGERMAFDDGVAIVVGTSAIGLYLGERGFRTFTFAPRVVSASGRFEKVLAQTPEEFRTVCQSI